MIQNRATIFLIGFLAALSLVGFLLVPLACSGTPDVPSNAWFFFADRLERQDYHGAYQRLCERLRTREGENAFANSLGRSVFPFLPMRSWEQYTGDGSQNEVSIVVLPHGAAPLHLRIVVEKENGKWRVCKATKVV